jgi:hypothetical protein
MPARNNKLLIIAVVIAVLGVQLHRRARDNDAQVAQTPSVEHSTHDANSVDVLERAFRDGSSNIQVEGQGVVTRTLSDDNDGSRHQRFILRLASGRTLLVAHNVDLAPRIDPLREGDTVRFFGEYEWNDKGGVLHWTHHDPDGRHPAGWLEHNGRRYE